MAENKNRHLLFVVLLLHGSLLLYSFSGVFSKMASVFDYLSIEFCFCYGGLILILGLYAIIWQQIIKRIPLTLAYANKAVTVIWGMIWGIVFFCESISATKLIGAVIVIVGVILYSLEDNKLSVKEDKIS